MAPRRLETSRDGSRPTMRSLRSSGAKPLLRTRPRTSETPSWSCFAKRWRPPCQQGRRSVERENWIIGRDARILVTGASGFIGGCVVETLLERGFRHLRCFARAVGHSKKLAAIQRRWGDDVVEVI